MRAPAEIVVEGLVKRFEALVAVDGASFEVEPGEMFGLIGPDGAGKSSTLRAILGLHAIDGGTVRTCGHEPVRERRQLSSKVGYLAQRFSLYGDLSVDENIAFFARVHGVGGWKARRDELLDLLRMTPFRERLADRLSGGMKQKLALACTLIHTPRLLVLDEPTTGVDPVSRRDFWRILAKLRREGMTILVTTPYLDEAERCSRVALMDRGRFLALDSPESLRRGEPGTMLEFVAHPVRRAKEILQQAPGVAGVLLFGERVHATLPGVSPEGSAGELARLESLLRAAQVEVDSARVVVPSLEDVFVARVSAGRKEVG
ncbi:MAG TPA: ABC transporter ATP-binding protein [Candidatus Polarisedimenticolaceae bacterium]